MFYNIDSSDISRIKESPSGSIIVIYPDKSKDLVYFSNPDDFLSSPINNEIIGISLAGICSYTSGAVGLARDVSTSIDGPVAAIVAGENDENTLKRLLKNRKNLKWLVGHSKGNHVISNSLKDLKSFDVNIVLFSALVMLPKIGHHYQIIGSLDLLGWANSQMNVSHKIVTGAMHHLNRNFPLHINVQKQIKAIIQTSSK